MKSKRKKAVGRLKVFKDKLEPGDVVHLARQTSGQDRNVLADLEGAEVSSIRGRMIFFATKGNPRGVRIHGNYFCRAVYIGHLGTPHKPNKCIFCGYEGPEVLDPK